MGTPSFAVPPLEMLYKNGYEIDLVVTQPDKARDRGKKVQFPPVKERAMEYGIEVLQPEKVKDNIDFINGLKTLNPDLIVVAAYGKILPLDILEIPRLGCINIHASLLPKYRGAAPIQRSIINGEEKTGITLMYMEEGLDTGDMIASRATYIEKKTADELHDELAKIGGALLIENLPDIEKGIIKRVKQENSMASYAPMIFKKDGLIDFSKSPEEIERLIRGLNSWPGAYTTYHGDQIKLLQGEAQRITSEKPFGTVLGVSKKGIEVAAGGRTLLITSLQMPGKKAMPVGEYLKGNRIDVNVVLGK